MGSLFGLAPPGRVPDFAEEVYLSSSPSPSLPPPFRPLPIRAMNVLGRLAGPLTRRALRLDEEYLLERAMREAGARDFGPESFRPGFRRLLSSLEADASLNTFGRFFAQRQVLELLRHRLNLIDYRRRHPEIDAERIQRPLFVLGLPRTGTTLLYGLLAQDPAHRSPLSWEVDDPCPPARSETYATDPRIEISEKRFEQLQMLARGVQAIHPVGAMLPQECIVLTAVDFMSIRFEMCFNVSGYQDWLLDTDMRDSYRFHRFFLQHMQSQHKAERWVLKSPGHLGPIDALLAEYPDAMVVQTHRDPLRVIPSVSSLEYTLRGVASDAIDPHEIGRQQLSSWSKLLEQGMNARDAHPERASQFHDVHFHEIVADPMACVRRIYDHFELPLTAEAVARMNDYLARNPRDAHGSHNYTLAGFGLDPDGVRQAFKAYSERFGVPSEPIV